MGYDLYTIIENDDNYFRANIFGMQMLRNAMIQAKIVDIDIKAPDFPDYQDSIDYTEECNIIRSTTSLNKNLVPLFKFCSNDGWHVLPEECLLINKALNKLLKKDKLSYFDKYDDEIVEINKEFVQKFSDYCLKAADKGGFLVN